MKKQIRVLITLLAIFVLFSFSGKPITGHDHLIKSEIGLKRDLNSDLYTLYIDNRPRSGGGLTRYQKLINSLNSPNTKLVFQYFFNNKDSLTLIVFSGPKDISQEYDTTREVKLWTFPDCKPHPSIKSGGVHLGDLEIQGGSQIDTLNKIKNSANSKFIVFIPKLDPEPNGRLSITYTIVTTDDLTTQTVCSPNLALLGAVSITNPSPPHKGN